LVWASYMTLRDQPLGEYVEGEHYVLAEQPRRVKGDKAEVVEFFSYGCIHCYNFDPGLEDWVQAQGDGVVFQRIPLVGSDYWRMLGRAYYTMQALNLGAREHHAMFREIHDKQNILNSPDKLETFFADFGVAGEDFQSAFNSAEVARQVARADQLGRRFKIAAVPTMVIQGKYVIATAEAVGFKRMIDVMDYLLEKERGGVDAGAAGSSR
ncbi:MAG: thiol:disulfide interchange protein DsbA/DsbL, partial [Pseudomonadales bacterium]